MQMNLERRVVDAQLRVKSHLRLKEAKLLKRKKNLPSIKKNKPRSVKDS